MASKTRYVDTLPAIKEPKPVEVLVLGLSRTGTMSMFTALKQLGYKPYHMSEACMNTGKGHLTMWSEAVAAKYGPGSSLGTAAGSAPYSSGDLAKLLQDFDALTDIPSILFVPELMEAFPRARLVLTTRRDGADGWLRSMRNSFFRISNWSVWEWPMMPLDPIFCRPYMNLVRRNLEIWTGSRWPAAANFEACEPRLRQFYFEHADEVRRLAKEQGRELLEFEAVDGWEPLCKFLGKDVPAGSYPRVNEGDSVANVHKIIILMRLKNILGPTILKIVASALIGGLALWWYRR